MYYRKYLVKDNYVGEKNKFKNMNKRSIGGIDKINGGGRFSRS